MMNDVDFFLEMHKLIYTNNYCLKFETLLPFILLQAKDLGQHIRDSQLNRERLSHLKDRKGQEGNISSSQG